MAQEKEQVESVMKDLLDLLKHRKGELAETYRALNSAFESHFAALEAAIRDLETNVGGDTAEEEGLSRDGRIVLPE